MQRDARSTKPPLVKETAPILQSSYNCQRQLRWLFKSCAPAKTLQYILEHRRRLQFQQKPRGWNMFIFFLLSNEFLMPKHKSSSFYTGQPTYARIINMSLEGLITTFSVSKTRLVLISKLTVDLYLLLLSLLLGSVSSLRRQWLEPSWIVHWCVSSPVHHFPHRA